MILRQQLIRQARRAFARSSEQARSRRWQSTEATTVFGAQLDDAVPFSAPSESLRETTSTASEPVKQQRKSVLQIAEEYNEYQRQKSLAKNLGGIPNPSYRPHDLLSNPPRPSEVTLELLLAAQSHMGHATSRWNPANSAYIFGVRDGTHIISLDVTAAHLRRAAKVVSAVAAKGGLILFVGTREGQERIVVRAAELAGAYHLFERWVPGSLTNSSQILGRCKLKVVNEFDEEVADANVARQVEALPPMKPDLVVCVNPLENRALLLECAQNGIPTVGVVDTDADPTWVTYPVPANDDSLRCISVIAGVLGRAGEEGRKFRLEQAAEGKLLATSNLPQKAANRRQGQGRR